MPLGDESQRPQKENLHFFSLDKPKTECANYKLKIDKEKNLSQEERKWIFSILDKQIECFDTLSRIDKADRCVLDAEEMLHDLSVALLKVVKIMQKHVVDGKRANDDLIMTELHEALVAFSKQKTNLDMRMKSFDETLPLFAAAKNLIDKSRQLLNDEKYKKSRNVTTLKNTDGSSLLDKFNLNVGSIEILTSRILSRHNLLKSRVAADQFLEDLVLATQVLNQYNALPPTKSSQSQVQQLNQSGAALYRPRQQAPVAPPSDSRVMTAVAR